MFIVNLQKLVSGTLLNMFSKGSILVDAGSGTYHQFFRKFGNKWKDYLGNIKCVWISHKHPDHHNGLIPLLKHRQQYLNARGTHSPIIIIGPRLFEGYFREISMTSTFRLEYQFFHYSLLFNNDHLLSTFFLETFGIIQAQTIKVIHGGDAAALVITHKTGWKIVFSGDTRPSKNLVQVGKDCTLLVHEATLCDAERKLALSKAHSTTSEALFVAKQMNAYRVVLTHFSQRQNAYPVADFMANSIQRESLDSPRLEESPGENEDRRIISDDEIKGISRQLELDNPESIIIGFDLMTINFADLASLPSLLGVLKCLYQHEHLRKHNNL